MHDRCVIGARDRASQGRTAGRSDKWISVINSWVFIKIITWLRHLLTKLRIYIYIYVYFLSHLVLIDGHMLSMLSRTLIIFLSIFPFFFTFFTAIVPISRAQLDVALLCRSAIESTYNSLVKEKSHLVDNANLLPIQVNFSLEATFLICFSRM